MLEKMSKKLLAALKITLYILTMAVKVGLYQKVVLKIIMEEMSPK